MATLLQLCQPFDHAVMAVIQQLSGAMMDKIMLVFTFLGEETRYSAAHRRVLVLG